MSETWTAEKFAKDVEAHEVQVMMDSGVYRHLRVRRPGTYCMGFDIVTYPGHLCYSGDMGTYVFSRLPDMFEFFRGDRVNYGYWAEKVEAKDKNGGLREFSADLFLAALRQDIDDLKSELSDDERASLDDAIEDAGLFTDIDGPDAVRRVMEFEWPRHHVHPFSEFYDHRLEEYTHHFYWCCHALIWAIGKYDSGETASRP